MTFNILLGFQKKWIFWGYDEIVAILLGSPQNWTILRDYLYRFYGFLSAKVQNKNCFFLFVCFFFCFFFFFGGGGVAKFQIYFGVPDIPDIFGVPDIPDIFFFFWGGGGVNSRCIDLQINKSKKIRTYTLWPINIYNGPYWPSCE